MKVMTILGTRPEIIRLCEIIKKLDKFTEHTLVHTGQNYDKNLNDIFFKELSLRVPDIQIKCKANNIQEQISKIIKETGDIMDKKKPDAIVILGDTNSGLSAISAKRKKIPIFHLEAGDRSFDNNVPEEHNRKIIDHLSDINLTYTEHSRRNLLNEGIHPSKVFVIGSPISEVYSSMKEKFKKSKVLSKLKIKKKKFFVASLHREENVDKEKNLEELVKTFNKIVEKFNLPLVVSAHPRTKRSLKKFRLIEDSNKLINWHDPFGLIDFIKLQMNSLCVVSDSGTIHEDSAILNFPAIAVRKSTEKYEAIDSGHCSITGLNAKNVIRMIDFVIKNFSEVQKNPLPEAYNQVNISNKFLNIILGMRDIADHSTWGDK